MLEILSGNEGLKIIAELDQADPDMNTRFAGAMEIHEGRHPQLGRVVVFREINEGKTVVMAAPRPTLTFAKSKAA